MFNFCEEGNVLWTVNYIDAESFMEKAFYYFGC